MTADQPNCRTGKCRRTSPQVTFARQHAQALPPLPSVSVRNELCPMALTKTDPPTQKYFLVPSRDRVGAILVRMAVLCQVYLRRMRL
jgi:hypothetical protein